MDARPISNASSAGSPSNEKSAPTALSAHIIVPSTPNLEASEDKTGQRAFFPWLENVAGEQKLSARFLTKFPPFAAVGLIGSALTVVLSFLVLHFFDGKPLVTGRLPKPAAWLSIVLSLNSILVHTAVTEGITVSWWYRANKQQSTVADLHRIWATGSNVFTAITEWRVFNYVALAAVIVATLPANGIILQNSVSTRTLDVNVTDPATSYSIADHLPQGMSATLDPDGSMDLYLYPWQQAMPIVIGNYDGLYKQSPPTNTSCKGYCEAVVRGIGFQSTCEDSLVPYNFPLDNQVLPDAITYNQSAPNVNYTVFDTAITWDHSKPNNFNLTTIWKNETSCFGELHSTICQLQLGSISYPVSVSFNGSNDGKYYWSLLESNMTDAGIVSDDSIDFKPYDTVAEPGGSDSTYGGVIAGLAVYFNSSITLNLDNIANTTKLEVNGFYAEQLNTLVAIKKPEYRCNVSVTTFGQNQSLFSTPYQDLLFQIRNTLFFTSIYAMEDNGIPIWIDETKPDPQVILRDLDQVKITKYHIIWSWYFGSLGLTLGIVLFILPTFYGFWTLPRNTTLSPLETARAFHAPILTDAPRELDTPALLKAVGGKNLHTDLASAPNSPTVPMSPFQTMSPRSPWSPTTDTIR